MMSSEHELNSSKEIFVSLSNKVESLDLSSTQPKLELTKPSLMEKLKEHKLYLLEWFRGESVTPESLPHLIHKLYLFVPSVNFCEDELEDLNELTNTTLQSAGAGIVEAFLCIEAKKYQGSRQMIEAVEVFLNYCDKFISNDYVSGFVYVISLLKLHLSLTDVDESQETHYAAKLLHISPEDIKPVQLATILSVRWQLIELFDARKVEAVKLGLVKIHRLDPENWVWSYLLCSRLRFLRRQSHSKFSLPEKAEIDAIHASLKFVTPKYKPMVEAAACLCLAEILRYRRSNRQDNKKITFGEITFQRNEGIAKFIVDTSKKALENKAVCFGELIRYGEILSSTIPTEFQDPLVSEECLRSALEITPENSKANHRLGLILLKWKKEKTEALEHLEKAVYFAPSNVPAYIDLVLALLSEQGEAKYCSRLKKIFDDVTTSSCTWMTTVQKASLLFYRGLFHLLSGDEEKAVADWIERSKLDKWNSFPSFIDLPGLLNRFSFSTSTQQLTKVNLRKFVKTVTQKIGFAKGSERRALQCLRGTIEGAQEVIWDGLKYSGSNNNGQRQQQEYHPPTYKGKQTKSHKPDYWKKQRPVLPSPSPAPYGKNSPPNDPYFTKPGYYKKYNSQKYPSPKSQGALVADQGLKLVNGT